MSFLYGRFGRFFKGLLIPASTLLFVFLASCRDVPSPTITERGWIAGCSNKGVGTARGRPFIVTMTEEGETDNFVLTPETAVKCESLRVHIGDLDIVDVMDHKVKPNYEFVLRKHQYSMFHGKDIDVWDLILLKTL